jgi:HAMP domain-containing protein
VEDELETAAAARLEAALERIAQRTQSRLAEMPQTVPPTPETSALASRLDSLIAQLRGALEQ